MAFSHSVGYRGICRLFPGQVGETKPTSGGKTVLCTGGQISLTQEPIMGTGVWGAGYANATQIAYAWNYLSLQGSANFELTGEASTTAKYPILGDNGIWSALKEYAFTDRTANHWVQLYPDGVNGFFGPGWLSSLSFEASQGAAITGSFNFKGDPSGDNIKTGVYEQGSTEPSSEFTPYGINTSSVSPLAGATLIPYWSTNMKFTDGDNKEVIVQDIMNWSCSYNSDLQFLKCCNSCETAPIAADYIVCGQMTAEGSYTQFRLIGDFKPDSYHKQRKNLTFNVADGYIRIPYALVNSGSTSMQTGASYVQVDYSFNALGNGQDAVMQMS